MNVPISTNEFERIVALSEYDLDYASLESQFADLTSLAAKVAGSQISLVNLIDSYTQWSVATSGIPPLQMDRNDAVCAYTILDKENFEVKDLSADERFKDKFYVKGEPNLKYYWGTPLVTPQGLNLGALCVMDSQQKVITPEKAELLKLISKEIVNRLEILKSVKTLQEDIKDLQKDKKKVAHDIRGPLAGIVGLAEIIQSQGQQNTLEDILEFITLIQKSGRSLLELADQIMKDEDVALKNSLSHLFNLQSLKEKLQDLYGAQARQKQIFFSVSILGKNLDVNFPKTKLLQIIGNIISNALKFTPENGTVRVTLEINQVGNFYKLIIQVKDSGLGMSQDKIDEILNGGTTSSQGTGGETGYGFGLSLVKYLIDGFNGTLQIQSEEGVYTHFTVEVPIVGQ